ncbi:MAG: AzlD domain-containing protein [Oscillospiraceae bacterium]|nr:AzlD domain-containing protein [Oscillospiraceae bacterium]
MSIYIYILAMAVTTYLIRVLPLTVFRKPIRSRFVKSFLHYVPYACLTAMTFPAILTSTESVISGAAALVVAVILAFKGKSLLVVSVASCCAVFITEQLLKIIM